MIKNIKEKIISTAGSASGATSILGSWQICHNLCLGIIVLLGVLGITVTGMPLMFLTKLAVPLWTIALILLLVTLGLYLKKRCISKNLIIMNSGLIIAGLPFQPLQDFKILFWLVGGVLVIISIIFFIKNKIEKRRNKK